MIEFFSEEPISPFRSSRVYNELYSIWVELPCEELGMLTFDEICIIWRCCCSFKMRYRMICLWFAFAIKCGSIEFFRILILMSLLEPACA